MKDDVFCYVGEWNDRPIGLAVHAFYGELLHPRDFQAAVDKLQLSIWTNNALIVSCFPPERVMVVYNAKALPLTKHPKFEQWKDEFDSGEFWSMYGEEWVTQ